MITLNYLKKHQKAGGKFKIIYNTRKNGNFCMSGLDFIFKIKKLNNRCLKVLKVH